LLTPFMLVRNFKNFLPFNSICLLGIMVTSLSLKGLLFYVSILFSKFFNIKYLIIFLFLTYIFLFFRFDDIQLSIVERISYFNDSYGHSGLSLFFTDIVLFFSILVVFFIALIFSRYYLEFLFVTFAFALFLVEDVWVNNSASLAILLVPCVHILLVRISLLSGKHRLS
jgi:hypothetical protein